MLQEDFCLRAIAWLPGGIYIVAGQSNNKYFELIVDKFQQFKVTGSLSKIPNDLQFEGSPENDLFYSYVNENLRLRRTIESLKQQMSGGKRDSGNQQEIDSLFAVLSELENTLIRNNPDSFVSVILRARQEPEPAADRFLEDGSLDSVFAYQSYKKHYWDNLDPADERLLRTPLYHKRIQNYFEKVVYQNPDSLIWEADKFIEKTASNRETYKYAIWFLTYKFETSKIMGFDEIFVHMVDEYYAKGKAFWAENSVIKSLKDRADELRKVLIGEAAQNMILMDTAGGFKSLYALESDYTLILFYEMSCNHCRKEIQQLKTWVPDNPYGLHVYAVCTDTSMVEWKKFITQEKLDWTHVNGTRSVTPDYHGLYDIRVTPTIYLLDEKKKILAKRLKAEQIKPFLDHYERRKTGNAGEAPK